MFYGEILTAQNTCDSISHMETIFSALDEAITWRMDPSEEIILAKGKRIKALDWCRAEALRLGGKILKDEYGQISVWAPVKV